MHTLEPFYRWREYYTTDDDERSPFYGRTYSEFEFSNSIYNYLIHPQWDTFGSPTLCIKILYIDYELQTAIIEMLGEWNDCIENDIMLLKRDVVNVLLREGINRYLLIGENVLNFHASDDCYYEEWFHDIEEGWIVALNFREHVIEEFRAYNLDYYLNFGGTLDTFNWRKYHHPRHLCEEIDMLITRRLNA